MDSQWQTNPLLVQPTFHSLAVEVQPPQKKKKTGGERKPQQQVDGKAPEQRQYNSVGQLPTCIGSALSPLKGPWPLSTKGLLVQLGDIHFRTRSQGITSLTPALCARASATGTSLLCGYSLHETEDVLMCCFG